MERVREPFNSLTHLAGAVLILLVAIYLVVANLAHPLAALGFGIFGLTATLLFAASGIYHWGTESNKWLRRFDHAAIYMMIAGTYTPVCLLALGSPTQWVVLTLQWLLALIGVSVSLAKDRTPTALRLTLYLTMGWMVVAVFGDLVSHSGIAPAAWLIGGGVAYTVGAVIYAIKKPNPWPRRVGSHGLWHVFVLAGAACHAVVMFVLPT